MIKICDLSFTYPMADEPILKNINLEVKKGDFVAIVGNNGCGKSTLCKTLNGLIPRFITGKLEGTILIDGRNAIELDISDLAKKIGYVYQDFENQIVCPTVLEDAAFACMNFGLDDYEERALKILKVCGLENKKNDYIWQLSGGQTHLLALAGATALSSDILVLDEPIAQLDPKHARIIYDVLKDLNENYGKTIIVIEHHSEYIAKYCKNVILMKDGSIKWQLPVREALSRVEELQECSIFPPQVTIAAAKLKEMNIFDSSISLPTTIEEARQLFKSFKYFTDGSKNIFKHPKDEKVIEFKEISLKYKSVKGEPYQLMDHFSLDIYKGDKIALIGSNGAGKSSLMKLMVGLLKPNEGQVYICNKNTRKYSAEQLSEHISLVYQNPEDMFIKDSIRADIEFAMKERKVENYKVKADELIELFDLKDIQNRDGRLMSGGQMRRASLAIGVALNPSILLLDEPTANLDIATRKDIMKTLNVLKDIVETVIIATHDMELVCDWAQRIIVLNAGTIVKDGTRNEVFEDKFVRNNVGIEPPDIYRMAEALNSRCYSLEEFVTMYANHREMI